MSTDSNSNQKTYVLIFILTVVIALITFLFFNIEIDDLNRDNFGMFGDYFGGFLTPTLTFITVIYLIQSINQQSTIIKLTTKQLNNSAEELQLTRNELSKSAIAQNEQARLLKESNNQALQRNEIIQTVELIKLIRLSINEIFNSKVDVFESNEPAQAIVMLTSKDRIENLETDGKPIDVQAAGYLFKIGKVRISRIEKQIPLINLTTRVPFIAYNDTYLGNEAGMIIQKLEKHILEYFYAFNTLLSSNTLKFCLHYADDLSDWFFKAVMVTGSKQWLHIIKTQANLSLELLETLDKNEDDNLKLLINIINTPISNIKSRCKITIQ